MTDHVSASPPTTRVIPVAIARRGEAQATMVAVHMCMGEGEAVTFTRFSARAVLTVDDAATLHKELGDVLEGIQRADLSPDPDSGSDAAESRYGPPEGIDDDGPVAAEQDMPSIGPVFP